MIGNSWNQTFPKFAIEIIGNPIQSLPHFSKASRSMSSRISQHTLFLWLIESPPVNPLHLSGFMHTVLGACIFPVETMFIFEKCDFKGG